MSFQAMSWAAAQKVNPTQKLVLLALANYADDSGKCWPSFATLAKDTCLCRRTIIRALDSLVEAKVISKQRRSKAGVSSSNIYRLPVRQGG